MKSAKERRSDSRELCSDFARIAWLDQTGRRFSFTGVIEDVSLEGMCLNLDVAAPLGARVHVHTKGFDGEARVCYCTLGDYGYLVGLEFLDGCTWDREAWRPKHLLTE